MPALPPIRPARRDPERPRLKGVLAFIFWCACGITAVPLAGVFSLIAALGPQGAMSAIADSLSGTTPTTQLLRLGLVPQLVLFVWGGSFVILTVMRSRVALTLLPVILLAWVVSMTVSQFAIRNVLAPDGLTVGDLAALLPGLLIQAVGALAFYGYMRQGELPQRYYTR